VNNNTWIDVSVPLYSGMVSWPGDPAVSIVPVKEIAKGGSSNVSEISMGAHTGTHMDAPRHFFIGGRGLDKMPLEATIGPARVIAIKDRKLITVEELREHRIRKGERILFKTHGSAARWRRREFDRNYVYVSPDAARYLAGRRGSSGSITFRRATRAIAGHREPFELASDHRDLTHQPSSPALDFICLPPHLTPTALLQGGAAAKIKRCRFLHPSLTQTKATRRC
jgi:hypothetical protein